MKNDSLFLTWPIPGLTLQEIPARLPRCGWAMHALGGKPAIRETSILIISKIKEVQAWLSETGSLFSRIKSSKNASPLQTTFLLMSQHMSQGGSPMTIRARACESLRHDSYQIPLPGDPEAAAMSPHLSITKPPYSSVRKRVPASSQVSISGLLLVSSASALEKDLPLSFHGSGSQRALLSRTLISYGDTAFLPVWSWTGWLPLPCRVPFQNSWADPRPLRPVEGPQSSPGTRWALSKQVH